MIKHQTENPYFIDSTDMGVIELSQMFKWTKHQVSKIVKFFGLKMNNEYTDFCKINAERE